MSASLLLIPEECESCGEVRKLYARIKGKRMCARCWAQAGQPSGDHLAAAHDLEVKTRERMTARGSTDRHMVRSGRT